MNKFVYYNNRKIPVKYVLKNPKWAWMNSGWLGDLSQISHDHIEYAHEIETKIKNLEKIAGQEYLNQYIVDSYAKELESSWRIEGEYLNTLELRSSLVKSLALDVPEWYAPKENVKSERENQAVNAALFLINSKGELNIQQLLDTHKILGQSDSGTVSGQFGEFRTGTEIVGWLSSDRSFYEIVFEAPPAEDVLPLMNHFIQWWRESYSVVPICIGAALAHLYFVEIHPFHDGNGRVARLLLDKYLSNSKNMFRPFSLQSTLHTHRFDNNKTIQKKSAITGASTTENCQIFSENDEIIVNHSREVKLKFLNFNDIKDRTSQYIV